MATAITCINCGIEGVIRTSSSHDDQSLNVFRRLGRNPVSGHLHYQCPACKMVLLVDRLLIRENNHIFARTPAPYPTTSADSHRDFDNRGFINPVFTRPLLSPADAPVRQSS